MLAIANASGGKAHLATERNNYCADHDEAKNQEMKETCLSTQWNWSHLLFHTVVGWCAPDYCFLAAGIGIAWEAWEGIGWDCHDATDVLFNVAGLLIGRAARRRWGPPTKG